MHKAVASSVQHEERPLEFTRWNIQQATPCSDTCMPAGSGVGKQPLAEPCAPITSGPLGVATPVSPPLPSTGVGASTSRAPTPAVPAHAPAAVRVHMPQRERRESVRLFLGDADDSPRWAALLGLQVAVLHSGLHLKQLRSSLCPLVGRPPSASARVLQQCTGDVATSCRGSSFVVPVHSGSIASDVVTSKLAVKCSSTLMGRDYCCSPLSCRYDPAARRHGTDVYPVLAAGMPVAADSPK